MGNENDSNGGNSGSKDTWKETVKQGAKNFTVGFTTAAGARAGIDAYEEWKTKMVVVVLLFLKNKTNL